MPISDKLLRRQPDKYTFYASKLEAVERIPDVQKKAGALNDLVPHLSPDEMRKLSRWWARSMSDIKRLCSTRSPRVFRTI